MNFSQVYEPALKWLYDPWVGKLVSTLIAVVVLLSLVGLVKRKLIYKISDASKRHRARKLVNFTGYILCIIIAASVFSDRLGKLTVIFGVAGAGIAFALQEVIASVAGWFAITFGGFFRTGDRIQLGGIRGDVIDIGVLRTTLMECGAWVRSYPRTATTKFESLSALC
jgi:small-conductance mechanosensitive channel